MKRITKEKTATHPLEEVFGIEPGTTITEYHEILPEPPIDHIQYDQKDEEIEMKLEEVYAAAMGQVVLIGDEMERVEGKYKARVGEVTATMLSVALGAARERRIMKADKDKLKPNRATVGNITNNTLNVGDSVIADRNDILKAFLGK